MNITQKHQIILQPHHVKSHQDDEITFNKLPLGAHLNSDIDKLAGNKACASATCLSSSLKSYACPPDHDGATTLKLEERWITSHDATTPFAMKQDITQNFRTN